VNDIRWKQRFENFEKAYLNFLTVIEALNEKPDNIINKMAIIQAYEMVFELGWKTAKDFLTEQGVEANFPREVIKEAFAYEIIDNGEIWIKMLEDRNLTVHTYDEVKANLIVSNIKKNYFFAIKQLYNYLKGKL
jgi:nucleotidyltransferase substrate binding protein (TIGR01987 family)